MTAKAASTHFTPADVFSATGVSVPKQNQWYDRRTVIPSRQDKRPSGSGSYRLVCAATVYQIALTAACIKLGISARHAADAARLFAAGQPGRPPNTLYGFDRTLLTIKETGAKIINAQFNASLTDICGRPFEAAIIIDVGQIIRAIDQSLSKKG
jgi:hypothetical protein